MKRLPKVGNEGRVSFVVEQTHAIDIAGDSALAVLSTPTLIWYLEYAARDALTPILDDQETSVGVSVDMEHLAATPVGFEVRCLARIVHVDGAVITFQVTAEDGQDTIARGVHKRRVLSAERFRAHVRRKVEKD